ncbi:hypothetical protein A2865_00530 [Candidatus Woesebacteria bacterium RIFCSPHIGHO2_01_FULL_39_17]|uniref:Glycosyl transferase family 39 n=2 Tax=Candidatus Woeseibacteriota TaxID=1752722 RepID=A0A0G0QUR6_9BACT|nr:MAG: hypothetical protein US72_C0001G0069 [Microgenomates group bacterium GW2011_GWC1_38_12]KKR14080.1 MAG: Glycosyl transferase family 39 [Candidatus Woesebacteria bacterium GW2011_GWA1_39_21b]OGM23673.1 MAG: hypothetical protein A2865_00530 [Candidatus Woesebacteria bacterium RIFCSPHIGHO2_01_FULL_39_17]OGM64704.1 MAG: hypothetical protein A3A52_04350 [Candidatus Woesebacteria bacterium RIFCSPLOWO2_01_FULL_39_14]
MQNVFNQSLWGDEGFSAILSMKSLPEIISIISRDTSPPLWNIWEWVVFNTLGTDEIYIRNLSFTFFLGTIFFTYKIASLFWSRKTGLLAALFLFLNPFFFIYAFEGRMYSIMSLGVAASMYYFLRIFYNEEIIRKRDKVGYVFFTLWALYSHHFAFFAVSIQGVWWLYELTFGKRIRAKKMFKLFLITAASYVPWLYPLYSQTKMVSGGFWLGTPTPQDLYKIIADYIAQGIKNENLTIPVLGTPLYHAALYISIATLVLRKWWGGIKKTTFLLVWFLGPILATWFISQKFQSIFFNRYLLYTIPAAMLVLVSSRSKLSIVPLAILAIFFGIMDYQYFTHPAKLPFREMAGYVKETQKEGDFLINWYSNGTHHIWETKYYGIPAPIYTSGDAELPFFVGTALMDESDIIREIPEGVKRIGVVTSGPIEEIEVPNFGQEEVKEFDGLKFIWYLKKSGN